MGFEGVSVATDVSTSPIEVLASATISTVSTTTSSVDARGSGNVSYWVAIGGLAGGVARLDVAAQWSYDGLSWFDQKTEAIAAGVATQSDYVAQFPVAAPGLVHLSLPTFGRRYSRAVLSSDAGTFTSTVVTATIGA